MKKVFILLVFFTMNRSFPKLILRYALNQVQGTQDDRPFVVSDSGLCSELYRTIEHQLQGMNAKTLKVAHRGASSKFPENTISAFRQALKTDADMIELDVHLTKDGHLVVFHDDELDRLTEGCGLISQKRLSELQKLSVLGKEKIPTLRQVFNFISFFRNCRSMVRYNSEQSSESLTTNGRSSRVIATCPTKPWRSRKQLYRGMNTKDLVCRPILLDIEIKGRKGAARAVSELIKEFVNSTKFRYSDFIVTSFEHDQILEFQKFLPQVQAGFIYDEGKIPTDLTKLKDSNLYWLVVDYRDVNSDLVKKAHRLGLKILVYTVNNKDDYQRLSELGVDAIATDNP